MMKIKENMLITITMKCGVKNELQKVVIGIDQSYKDTGISVACNGLLLSVSHFDFKGCSSNSQKRKALKQYLDVLIKQHINNCDKLIIICERIRLKSQGFLNIDYIKSIGALNACIVDVADDYNIEVYSVDTRSWKSKIVGTSKPKENKFGINPEKWPTIQYVRKLGFEESILDEPGKRKKGVIKKQGKKYFVNDNAADSACIALYGFLEETKQMLERET